VIVCGLLCKHCGEREWERERVGATFYDIL